MMFERHGRDGVAPRADPLHAVLQSPELSNGGEEPFVEMRVVVEWRVAVLGRDFGSALFVARFAFSKTTRCLTPCTPWFPRTACAVLVRYGLGVWNCCEEVAREPYPACPRLPAPARSLLCRSNGELAAPAAAPLPPLLIIALNASFT